MMRVLGGLLVVIALVYMGLCAALFVFQRNFIYFPQPLSAGSAKPSLVLQRGDDAVLVSTRERKGPQAVIYFGGNAEDVAHSMPTMAAAFPQHALYLLHYRGYGGSTGVATEAALFSDALALYDHVRATHPNVVVVGRSLGSGVAAYLASQRPVQRLVLVTPYDSMLSMAMQRFPYFPVQHMLQDKFESWRYAEQVTAPTQLLLAQNDEVIARAHSEALHRHFRPGVANVHVLPGVGHNTIASSPQYIALLSGE